MKLNTCKCNKPNHFIKEYERIFAGANPSRLLEIGVQTGNSLRMWATAFPDAEIIGLDVNPEGTPIPEPNVRVVLGDQTDTEVLTNLGNFDVIIDDGSHMTSHQQITFNHLWNQLNPGGLYVIEDLETSHIEPFIDTTLTTMEFLQKKLDVIDVSNQKVFAFENEGIKRMTFVKDLVILEKV